MKIEHIAIWTKDVEALRVFYEKYFNALANQRYENMTKGFASYFLSFESGARLEIMQMEGIEERQRILEKQFTGLAHFAISVGSKEAVNELTARLEGDGYLLVDGPRKTGDGYYESVILDPDGNRVEITV